MTLLRRPPREVYRVYTEEEYLNGAGLEPAVALAEVWPLVAAEPAEDWLAAVEPGNEWPVALGPSVAAIDERRYGERAQPVTRVARERGLRRAAGVAMLAGALGTVAGVVAANNPWVHRGAGRRPGSLVAEARAPRAVRSRITRSSVPARPFVTHRSEAAHPHVARAVGSDPHPPNPHPSDTRRPASPHGGVAVVVGYAPSAPAGRVVAPSASADGSAAATAVGAGTTTASPADEAPASAATASAATARAGAVATQAEFGFER